MKSQRFISLIGLLVLAAVLFILEINLGRFFSWRPTFLLILPVSLLILETPLFFTISFGIALGLSFFAEPIITAYFLVFVFIVWLLKSISPLADCLTNLIVFFIATPVFYLLIDKHFIINSPSFFIKEYVANLIFMILLIIIFRLWLCKKLKFTS